MINKTLKKNLTTDEYRLLRMVEMCGGDEVMVETAPGQAYRTNHVRSLIKQGLITGTRNGSTWNVGLVA